jgi:glutaredoxin
MLLIIGSENCGRCHITKELLNQKGIEYEYKLMSSLSEDEKNKYLNMAKEKKQMSMPLIIKDGQLITLQEV